ncbi:MAG: hypothetical protein AAGA54_13630 [Myxococcota bacterium]
MSRNTLFVIGGALLAVVLYFGYAGGDEAEPDDAKVAAKKKKGAKKKKHSKRAPSGSEGGVGVGKMCAKLDCSEAQLKSFKSMVKDHRKQTTANRRALKEAYALIAAEYAEDALDTAALDDAFAQVLEERSAIDVHARGVLEAMHGKLTAQQREGLAKLVALHGPTTLLERPKHADANKGRKGKGRKGKHKGKGHKGHGRKATALKPSSATRTALQPRVEEAGEAAPSDAVEPPAEADASADPADPADPVAAEDAPAAE